MFERKKETVTDELFAGTCLNLYICICLFLVHTYPYRNMYILGQFERHIAEN